MVLTAKQKSELHSAIIEYLATSGFRPAAEVVAKDFGLDVAANNASGEGILEKKWSSVVRLQKKVLDLEEKISQLEDELKQKGGQGGSGPMRKKESGVAHLPRAPHARQLVGHRNPLTRVIFHQFYSLIVTCGEDAQLKIWDYETGELERSVSTRLILTPHSYTFVFYIISHHPHMNAR
jgi:platelet-activating factor acetylhydrolase IB subunit alpha